MIIINNPLFFQIQIIFLYQVLLTDNFLSIQIKKLYNMVFLIMRD